MHNAKQKFVAKKLKENGVEAPEATELSAEEFIAEHERLIKVLRNGSREELLAEAKKQEEELNEFKDD